MSLKYTKSSMFLFPLLGIPKSIFQCSVKNIFKKEIFNNRFLNCYMSYDGIDKYKTDHLFLLVRNYRDIGFDVFYSTITAFSNYVDEFEIDECIVFIFSISDIFSYKRDYKALLSGKYSLISPEGKKAIMENSFHNFDPLTLPMIFGKSPALKEMWENKMGAEGEIDLGEQEVWPIIIKEKEILNKNIVKAFSKKEKFDYKGEY